MMSDPIQFERNFHTFDRHFGTLDVILINMSQIRYDVYTLKITIFGVILLLEQWGFEVEVRFVIDCSWVVLATGWQLAMVVSFMPTDTPGSPLYQLSLRLYKACFPYQPINKTTKSINWWRPSCGLQHRSSATEVWSPPLKYPWSFFIWRRNSVWKFPFLIDKFFKNLCCFILILRRMNLFNRIEERQDVF